MKLKILVLDLEISARQKRWLAVLAVPALVALGAGVASAKPLHTWLPNDVLKSTDLNATFDDLDARLSALDQSTNATAVDLDTRVKALQGELAAKTVVLAGQVVVHAKNNPFVVGSITVAAPAPGMINVTALGGQAGFFDHVNGTYDGMVCCVSDTINTCPATVAQYQIHRSEPSMPGGAEGIAWPLAASSAFSIPAAGAYTFNLVCSWQSGGGGGAFAGNGVALTATYFVSSL